MKIFKTKSALSVKVDEIKKDKKARKAEVRKESTIKMSKKKAKDVLGKTTVVSYTEHLSKGGAKVYELSNKKMVDVAYGKVSEKDKEQFKNLVKCALALKASNEQGKESLVEKVYKKQRVEINIDQLSEAEKKLYL